MGRGTLGMASLDFGDQAVEGLDERVNGGGECGVTVGFADDDENTIENS